MNGELLMILEHIEREKGIDRKVLIEAVEAALVSAAKKVLSSKKDEDISVKIDATTGSIHVFTAGEEISPLSDFGRIAAQTAKQVIIQKIREAEKDVIFTEYQAKLGDIVSGTVHRFEKGNIIVDLGRTEGLLPRREQSPREEYRQGNRIRTLILEVERSSRGPQVILSRAHPNLVRRLFELEVPEISEGIVEIKSLAREAGERSKCAVFSKDEKVDCVGACIGMRGTRIKSIIRELHGEKIDVIRWSQDLKDYATAALSPAQISEVKIDKETEHLEIIVEDEQLSLAIGKRGQNVRLASRLIGWEIDVRSKSQLEAIQKKLSLRRLAGVGPKLEKCLQGAGFEDARAVAKGSLKELKKIKGIGKDTASKLKKEARRLVANLSKE